MLPWLALLRAPAWRVCALLIAGLALAAPAATPARAEDAAAAFRSRCARCHGDDGQSDTADGRALKVAPLVNDARLAGMSAAAIAAAVKSNVKHRAVVQLEEQDVDAAAAFVKVLAAKH
jgi:mono/diheme cytochrome c family protein